MIRRVSLDTPMKSSPVSPRELNCTSCGGPMTQKDDGWVCKRICRNYGVLVHPSTTGASNE